MSDNEQDYEAACADPLANIIREALHTQDARTDNLDARLSLLVARTAAKVRALLADGTTPTEPASVVGGGAELIAAERLRQVTGEGWTPEHDAEHTDGSMVRAAVCYASYGQKASAPYPLWPWADSWWKPSDDPIKNLVRAGALIAAEIDRINGTTLTEPAAAPFCTRCDGYGVVLPVGYSIVVTCPACNGKTADRPERGPKAGRAAAPPVDTLAVREIAALFDPPHPADAGILHAAADELDARRARHAELVALVAEWRAYACDGNTCPDSARSTTYCADALVRIVGEPS